MFEHVKEGDLVTRMLCGTIPIEQKVVKVDEKLIYTGHPTDPGSQWTFDRNSGIEVDDEMGFGPLAGITGSILTHVNGVQVWDIKNNPHKADLVP